MKKFYVLWILVLCVTCVFADQKTAYTSVGDICPVDQLKDIDGQNVKFKNNVAVLCLFATWCPPCQAELPEIQKLRLKYQKRQDLIISAVGRDHNIAVLKKFRKAKGFTFHLIPDPERKIFNKFAKANIPRLYLVDRTGKIVFQSMGYDKKQFENMVKLLEKELQTIPTKK